MVDPDEGGGDTRYPVTYWSTSKQQEIALEDMNAKHLLNAYRKLRDGADPEAKPELLECMRMEIARRELNEDPE